MANQVQNQKIRSLLAAHDSAFRATFNDAAVDSLEQIAEKIAQTLKAGGKILLCGNGGSAADSQHIAAEFIGRFKKERKSLPAIALTTDSSILTAIGNDYSFERIFERQVEGLGAAGDILMALSTSGKSKNVIEAVKKAKSLGLTTVGFTGSSGGELKKIVDLNFSAVSEKTPHIQEMHITALHAISEAVEDKLFPA